MFMYHMKLISKTTRVTAGYNPIPKPKSNF